MPLRQIEIEDCGNRVFVKVSGAMGREAWVASVPEALRCVEEWLGLPPPGRHDAPQRPRRKDDG